jgi:hypothetical protein
MNRDLERTLARQHGIVTWTQMRDAKLSENAIRSLVKRKHLRRVRPATYALVGVPPSWEQTLLSAVLAAGDGAVASHTAAARLWGFPTRLDHAIEIVVPGHRHVRLQGVRAHRSVGFAVARRHGIPCTTFERTLCDCTSMMSYLQASRALDDGLRRGVASLRRLERCAHALKSAPGRPMGVITGLLAERPTGYHPGGSNDERRVLETLKRAGMPLPVQQHRVDVPGHTYHLDYAYPELMAFLEYDETTDVEIVTQVAAMLCTAPAA